MDWWRGTWVHPGIRALFIASFLALLATSALAVGAAVYAYAQGGAGLVSYFGVVSTLPGAVLTPLLMETTARGRADRVLRRTTLTRTVLVAAAAAAVLAALPPILAVSLAGLAVSLGRTLRPTYAVLLPWLARTPRELTAATVAARVAENGAALAGPVVAGVLLAWADPALTMTATAGLMATSTVVLYLVSVPARMGTEAGRRGVGIALRGSLGGTRALLRLAPPGGVAVLTYGQTFVSGALGVLVVLLSLETLDLGDSGVGWLNAALGLGGLVGAVVGSRVIRLDRLARFLVAGVLLWGAGTAALAGAPGVVVALLLLAVVGAGNAVEDVGLFTLVPRRLGPRAAASGFGALVLIAIVGLASGAVLAPALADALGIRGALFAVGGALTALALAYWSVFARVDKGEPPPSADVDLLRGLPAFSVLPLAVLEELAASLEEEHFEPEETVVDEGDEGDRFRVVKEGQASVQVRGVEQRTVSRGDGFGEIALLRDIPRTATVTALSALTTVSMDRSDFLSALATMPTSRAQAEADAAAKLHGDPRA